MAPGCRRHLHGVPRVKQRSAFDTMLTSPCYAPFPNMTALVKNQCQVSREIMWSKALSGSLSEAWFEILIVVGGSGSFRLCLGVLPKFKLAARTHADDCVRSNIFSDRFFSCRDVLVCIYGAWRHARFRALSDIQVPVQL